jgi:hypothetical protein
MTNWREAHSWSRQNRKQTQFYTIVGERKSEKEILEEKAVAIRSQINQEIGMSMHRNEPMKTPSVITSSVLSSVQLQGPSYESSHTK